MTALAKPTIHSVAQVFKLNRLSIPNYQRPYRWSLKHVYQLIDDLLSHQQKEDKGNYRLGTVVLHQDHDGTLNIVDGQQRLITLSLILRYLSNNKNSDFLMDAYENHLKKHKDSREHLENNWAAIHHGMKIVQSCNLMDFINNHCEFVVVILTDISEAFQFFDSQNARGKALKPYDLLKAFHLREMSNETKEAKESCVKSWEEAVEDGKLEPLFDDYLYRIRRWLRSESGLKFTKDDIEVFKGVTLSNKAHPCPHVKPYQILELLPLSKNSYPFQVNQTIINGKRFFEYVLRYQELLDYVETLNHREKKGELFKQLNNYEGKNRTGDKYTRNLFNAGLLCFIDRFGDQDLDAAAWRCFTWAYAIRFKNHAVKMVTMDNKGQGSFLRQMQYAIHPDDILKRSYKSVTENKSTKTDAIYTMYQEYFGGKS